MDYKNWIKENFSSGEHYGKLQTLIEKSGGSEISVTGLYGSSLSFLIGQLSSSYDKNMLILCSTEDEAKNMVTDIETLGITNAFYFPAINTTAYQPSFVNDEISSLRLDVLKHLLQDKKCIIVASVSAAIFHVTPKKELTDHIITISKEDVIDFDTLINSLVHSGYRRVKQVGLSGEFAQRGDILDIYYSSLKSPVRISFFDDQVESIRNFNPDSQKSDQHLESITIMPHKELVYNSDTMLRAKRFLKKLNGLDEVKEQIIEKIEQYEQFEGEQYYLHLFYEKAGLFEFLDDYILLINEKTMVRKKIDSIYREFESFYHESMYKRRPKVDYNHMLFSLEDITRAATTVIGSVIMQKEDHKCDIDFSIKGIPVYMGNLELFKKDIREYIAGGYTVILFSINDLKQERLASVFKELEPVTDVTGITPNRFHILPSFLSHGCLMEVQKLFILNEYEIFGKKTVSKHFYTRRTEVIDSFIDLKPGDYVVHIKHGIGKFTGIERIKSYDVEKDYIAIQYAGDDSVLIPIEQLNLIQKYASGELSSPRLDRIGSKNWTKKKDKVKQSVDKLAQELIKLYSFRLEQKGFAHAKDTPWQKEFELKFPYEETPDQIVTIEEVKRDMESTGPMDRLICGDVGFGKTEVAIRAAFKAVMSGKQVVMFIPTTILAEQHYETICERMSDYPIKIEMLSRFRSAEQQRKIIKDVAEGEIDILVGTHRVLSKDVTYKNLGLLIVDEEHRFGVKHKEKIKLIKKNLDSLSMTATPIPRTLHMSLSEIRDMSIINTPPKERQPVETYVMEFNEEVIIQAIRRELEREGQIFFLYNRVKTIQNMKKYLETLVPEARIVIAHGQLEENELEDIIHAFIHYEYDILLTTTIIESGIDIPRANTILIDRSDKFGLAQLYQLRGRVGRSDIKAYAYLFYESKGVLTEDAMKRLRVISEYSDLGSGLKVAMKDMEIRGAGNLLGPEQHGDILAVGFNLYCKLLTDAVKDLKRKMNPEEAEQEEEETLETDVFLDLHYTGYIPDSYISDPKQKMEIYKKISGVVQKDEIERITRMLTDRYGKLTVEVEKLLYLSELRILCKELHIFEIIEKLGKNSFNEQVSTFEIKFSDPALINIEKVMAIIASKDESIYLVGNKPESIFFKIDEEIELEKKVLYIKEFLEKIKK